MLSEAQDTRHAPSVATSGTDVVQIGEQEQDESTLVQTSSLSGVPSASIEVELSGRTVVGIPNMYICSTEREDSHCDDIKHPVRVRQKYMCKRADICGRGRQESPQHQVTSVRYLSCDDVNSPVRGLYRWCTVTTTT